MQITNGTVERTYKPGDYETRKVALSFNIDPGEDVGAVVAHVASLAEHHARMQPGQPASIVVPTPAAGRKGKKVDEPAPAPAPQPAVDPFAVQNTPLDGQVVGIEAEVARVEAGLNAIVAGTAPADPFAGGVTTAPVVTDTSVAPPTGTSPSAAVGNDPRHSTKALQDACADKIAKIADLPAKQAMVLLVKKLRADFTGDPVKGCEAIPAERRGDFLAQLAALA